MLTAKKTGDTQAVLRISSTLHPNDRSTNEFYVEVFSPSKTLSVQTARTPQVVSDSKVEEILVAITSEPSGDEIWLDGDFVGSSPSTIKMGTGTHNLKII